MSPRHPALTFALGFLALLSIAPPASAQSATAAEARTTRSFEAARKAGAPQLYAFLKLFPKGADLHMHLSGAVYAETFLREAATQNLCIDTARLALAPAATRGADCPAGQVPAAGVSKNQALYDNLVNSFSMRSFVPTTGFSGHDQFFSTFGKFGGLRNVAGEWLDEVTTRAAAQNEQYLEIMQTPSFTHAAVIGYKLGWPATITDSTYRTELPKLRQALLAGGLRDDVPVDQKELGDADAARRDLQHCAVPTAGTDGPLTPPACSIHIHFLYQVLRGFPPQQVFAQTLLGFEVATADPTHVVGLNFVMPEDGFLSMHDYHLQMLMLDYLHSVYPAVHISLHAGELAPGLVPPEGLAFHIREAVELGHAERIGHGIDILYEDHAADTLKEMAARHIDVEINLISNQGILGITGSGHPLAAYRAAHVPFSLSTDDEGVSRTDLTHNYVQAVLDQHLTYSDLKQSARASLQHSFLPGPSLYLHPDDYTHRVAACAAPINLQTALPPGPCAAFLAANEKAAQQYQLELRFATFEAAPR